MSVAQQSTSPPKKGFYNSVLFAVMFYMGTSITMVLANKWLLKETPDIPLTLLWLQIVVAVLLIAVTHAFGILSFNDTEAPEIITSSYSTSAISRSFRSFFKSRVPRTEARISKSLGPLIAVNVVGLSLNTLCLKWIDASMYQVARSLILPFTVIFQYLFLKNPSSIGVILSCAIVCCGFFVGMIFGEGSNDQRQTDNGGSFVGILFGLLSSITTALHAIIIKSSMDIVRGNTMVLVWYNNLLSAVFLLPIIIFSGEIISVYKMFGSDTVNWSSLLLGTIVTGVFGFLINIAGFLQIKVTSPITHMISSAVRGVLQTFLAVWLFSEILTANRMMGIVLILGGSSAYTWLKSTEHASSAATQKSSSVNELKVSVEK
ncbi:hypothetical protein MP638_001623 [Amoeboaphelidium occidentale]|nr:hypothetical protein MP638_001623 [Amoeboaphelidium occidentale]